MARSSWILVALVGLVMVGSGMAMLEACPEGRVYADCKNPCGETPEANPCAGEEVNNYCKVSWCKPEGEEPGVCSYACTAPPPPMLIRTMMFNDVSDGSDMATTTAVPLEGTYVEGEQPLPVDMPVEYLYDEQGNPIRPIAYNYRGGGATEGSVDGPVETYPVDSSLEGVDPIIYQTTGPKEDNPLSLPTSEPVYEQPTKVYKGGDKPSPRGTKKTKGTKCDQPLARCLVDPCTYTKCGPNTECVRNYCGGCNASCAPKKGSKGPKMGPTECQAGSYLAKVGKTTACKKCQAGTYMEEVNSYGKCTPCEAGTYAPRGGAASCLSCPYGTSSKGGARRCRRDAPQKVSGPKGAPAKRG